MQTQVTNLQRSVQQTMAGLQSQQQNIGNQLNRGPGNAYNRFFNNIVNQSRRSGSAVAAGAKQGQHGLLAMAAAGTAAFTAISAVQRVAQSFTSTIAQTAATGRLAAASGVSPVWLSRLQTAAYRRTAADPGATGEAVFGLRQQIERLQAFGEWSETLKKLSILNVDFTSGTPDEIIQRIMTDALPQHLKGLSLPRAMAFGQDIGLSRELTQFYHQYNPRAEMGGVAGVSATQGQIEQAEKLAEAIRNVETAWSGVLRAVQTSNPQWTEWTNSFAKWLENVQQSPKAMEAMGQVATAVIGVTMVAAVGTFLKAVMAANARIIASPIGVLILAGMGAQKLISPEAPSQEAHDFAMSSPSRFLDPNYWLKRGVYGTPYGPKSADQRNFWERHAPGWAGGKPAPTPGSVSGGGAAAPSAGGGRSATATPGGGGGGTSANPLPATVYEAIAQAEGTMKGGKINYDDMLGHPGGVLGTPPKPISQMTITELLDWQTQMLRNPNNKWDSSAAGAFQIVSTNIRAALKEGRLKPTDVFDQKTQEKLAAHLWAHGGSRHWEGFKAHEGLRAKAISLAATGGLAGGGNAITPQAPGARAVSQKAEDAARAARGERTVFPPGTKFNSRGEAVSDALGTMTATEKANVEASMAAIRAAQAAGKGWGTPAGGTTTTTNHGNVQIDRIEVSTQATNPYAIGGGIAGAIKNNLIASQANTGLE